MTPDKYAAYNAARRISAHLKVPKHRRISIWRKLNAALAAENIALAAARALTSACVARPPGMLTAAVTEHIPMDLTEDAGRTLLQSDERCFA